MNSTHDIVCGECSGNTAFSTSRDQSSCTEQPSCAEGFELIRHNTTQPGVCGICPVGRFSSQTGVLAGSLGGCNVGSLLHAHSSVTQSALLVAIVRCVAQPVGLPLASHRGFAFLAVL